MLMTTLHYASQNSQTETAMALVEAGADVNRKDSYGCGLRLYRRVVGLSQRRGRTPLGRCCRRASSSVQEYSAALCIDERPHGDCEGGCQGRRGRGLQEHPWVMVCALDVDSKALSSVLSLRGERSIYSGCCSWTALQYASHNGHAETALALVKAFADVRCKTNVGYVS